VAELAQPNASQLPPELLESLLFSVAPEYTPDRGDITYRDQHSNDFAEIRIREGRSLIVKRARFAWAEPRFTASRIASTLIREATGVEVPAPLPLPAGLGDRAMEVYWRIETPTLQEVWSALDSRARAQALHSWGELTARLHSVQLEGWGPLGDPATQNRTLGEFLEQELRDRLLPAVTGEWAGAVWIVERLLAEVPEVVQRTEGRSRLVHNDLHMGNVLCAQDDLGIRCVGLIDLETAVAAPPEADLAAMEVHHGPLFEQLIPGHWVPTVMEGYRQPLDQRVVNFYRALHLVNMGFYSAMIGHEWHAERVAEAAAMEVGRLD
jgi:aminoglycoside phosphotransferase (APT) family kinase protein